MGRQRHPRHTKPKENHHRDNHDPVEFVRVGREAQTLEPSVKRDECRGSEQEVEQRPERMGVKRGSELTMNESGPTRGQSAPGTGPVEEQNARAGREPKLPMSAVTTLVRRQIRADRGDRAPKQEPEQLATELLPVVVRLKQGHGLPRLG